MGETRCQTHLDIRTWLHTTPKTYNVMCKTSFWTCVRVHNNQNSFWHNNFVSIQYIQLPKLKLGMRIFVSIYLKQTPHWVLLLVTFKHGVYWFIYAPKFLISRHYNLFCCISSNMRWTKSWALWLLSLRMGLNM